MPASVVRRAQADRRGEHRGLGAVEPLDEGHQAAVVAQHASRAPAHGARRAARCVSPEFRNASSRSRRSSSAKSNSVWVKVAGLGLKVTSVPLGASDGPDDGQRRLGVAVAEADEMLLALAPDAHLHPLGQRVDHGRADAVQAAGHLVGVLVELAARVQPGQHHLGGRDAFLLVDVGRDAAAVVAHGDAAVAVQRQLDLGGEAGLRLVHRVVDDLERHVVQAGAVIGVADIHARPLAHGVQAAQDGDRGGVVGSPFRARNRGAARRCRTCRRGTPGACSGTLDI